jgi:hypothetical protein
MLFLVARQREAPMKSLSWSYVTLPKPGKDPKFPQNLRPISLLSTAGKLFQKVILKFLQKHIDERGLLNASQFGFRARHSTTFQCMWLADHITLNLKKKDLRLRCSLTSKKPLIPHGTQACCINLQNWNFRTV